jgi:hypothetical protein
MFEMDLERKAFITTFSKFTFLTSLADLKAKNIESIRTLLEIALEEGNLLGESWREVVLCISQLERLQLFGSEGEQEMQRIIQRFIGLILFILGHLWMNSREILDWLQREVHLLSPWILRNRRVWLLLLIGCLLVVLI